MDLQLNISIPQKKKEKTPAKAEKSKEFTFISKPVFAGKTLARKRPTNHASGKQFNFPKSNESFETERPSPKSKFNKKFEGHKTVQNDVPEQNTSAYQKLQPKQNKSDEPIENLANDDEKLQDDEKRNSKKNARTPHKDNFIRGVSLDPKKAFISSLFKNNPSVPRIGQRAVKPIVEKVFSGKTFSDLNIHKHCIANLDQNLGLKELTTVQQKASPIMLQGRDVLIRSQTGSGKTLAYALPIVEALQAIRPKINRHNGIRVLVVVPTRELAVQTYELFIKLVKPFTWVVPGLLSGGQKRKAEKARLRKGLNILVGTPGRICDHLRHTESLNFGQTRCLILDEADRLLDMGYEKDVAAIVKALDDHNISSRTYDPNPTANNGGYDPMALMRASVNKKTVFADEEEVETPQEEVAEDIEEVTEEKDEVQEDKASGGKHNLTDVFHSKQRQTVLLSATLTKAVEKLAGLTMIDPVFVDASEGRTSVVADSLNNTHIPEEPKTKIAKASKKEKVQSPVKSEEEIKDEDEEVKPPKKGLKPFSGTLFPELFETDTKKETLETAPKPKVEDDSDSDSDYEYFKVQKKFQDTKQEVVSEQEDSESEEQAEESAEVQKSDSFKDALKSALEDDELILPETVKQTFMITPMKLRLVTLASLIVEHCVMNSKGGKMIVFVATQDMVDYHCDLLQAVLCGGVEKAGKRNEKKKAEKIKKSGKKGKETPKESSSDEESKENGDSDFEIEIPTERDPGGLITLEIEFFKLHGSMKHEDRIDVFKEFRSAKNGVLFCTDVAARGLDLPRVDLVLQYCAPASATDYVHRVGRTGRAARSGEACLFLLPSEAEFVRHLESKRIRLKQADDAAALSPLTYLVPGQQPHRAAIAVQSRAESIVAGSKGWLEQGSKAFTSWVRFYAGYPRAVKEFLDRGELHLGHAAKAFGLRDSPAAVGRRVKHDTVPNEKPNNRLTVERTQKIRQQPPKLGPGKRRWTQSSRNVSEYDSGLPSKSKKKKD